MAGQAANRDPFVRTLGLSESFIIVSLVDSCFSGASTVSALRF